MILQRIPIELQSSQIDISREIPTFLNPVPFLIAPSVLVLSACPVVDSIDTPTEIPQRFPGVFLISTFPSIPHP